MPTVQVPPGTEPRFLPALAQGEAERQQREFRLVLSQWEAGGAIVDVRLVAAANAYRLRTTPEVAGLLAKHPLVLKVTGATEAEHQAAIAEFRKGTEQALGIGGGAATLVESKQDYLVVLQIPSVVLPEGSGVTDLPAFYHPAVESQARTFVMALEELKARRALSWFVWLPQANAYRTNMTPSAAQALSTRNPVARVVSFNEAEVQAAAAALESAVARAVNDALGRLPRPPAEPKPSFDKVRVGAVGTVNYIQINSASVWGYVSQGGVTVTVSLKAPDGTF
ncbi:MAG: hypothetical protein HY331_09290, partial [Chloroflexi bacterium]|nr:hypothetical protein [Chloroflexota bacterium]